MFIDPSTTKTKLRRSGTLLCCGYHMSLLPELRSFCFAVGYKHFAPTALGELFQYRRIAQGFDFSNSGK